MKLQVLSLLEVEELDTIGKQKEEEDNPANMGGSHERKKIIFKSHVSFEENLYFIMIFPPNFKFLLSNERIHFCDFSK